MLYPPASDTHRLCYSYNFFQDVQGTINLVSNTAPLGSIKPSSVAAIQRPMPHLPLHVVDGMTGVALIPAPDQVRGVLNF
jgi:hypothetical protein